MDEASGSPAPSGWHSYRCPVCGHADEVELADAVAETVACSHCGTSLDVSVRAPDQAPVAVKVAAWRRRPR